MSYKLLWPGFGGARPSIKLLGGGGARDPLGPPGSYSTVSRLELAGSHLSGRRTK